MPYASLQFLSRRETLVFHVGRVCVCERERQAVWVCGHVLNQFLVYAGYITHALQPGLVSYMDLMAFAHHAVMYLA